MLPLNGLQNGTHYAARPVGNSPDFMPLDKFLNRDILHSLHIHSIFSCYILDGEAINEEEINICFSYSTLMEITRGLKRIWDSQIEGAPSSARIIEYVERALEALEIFFRANFDPVEGLADKNEHRRKDVDEGESVSWGGAITKGEERE